MLVGKLHQRHPHQAAELLFFQRQKRVAVITGYLALKFASAIVLERFVQGHRLFCAIFAPEIKPYVYSDPVQPGAEVRLVPEGAQRPIGSDECFLRQILGVVAVARKLQAEGVNPVLVDSHQLFKSRRVSPLCSFYQQSCITHGRLTPSMRKDLPFTLLDTGKPGKVPATGGQQKYL
ncbi:MAG: hypothetical protein A4E53_04479 [Pelotomaculum sp. PtaB.Bin104]|nr:MAG: hypothetical protein A4E53_04479 [Pelotomaculum sp. PtaB.Bin104]